jgi:hypothetical protein
LRVVRACRATCNYRVCQFRKRPRPPAERSGAICRVCGGLATFLCILAPGRGTYGVRGSVWSAARFSALQQKKYVQNYIEMAANPNAGVFQFCVGVVAGAAVARAVAPLLTGSCPVPARFHCPRPRWPLPARFLPGSCPAAPHPARFLPCPVPARFLPGSCPVPAPARLRGCGGPTAGQDPPRSGGSCAGAAGSNRPHHSRVLHHAYKYRCFLV